MIRVRFDNACLDGLTEAIRGAEIVVVCNSSWERELWHWNRRPAHCAAAKKRRRRHDS